MIKETHQLIAFQNRCEKFWENRKSWCQTALVEHLFAQEVEGFHHEYIENYWDGEAEDEDADVANVLEWWLIPGDLSLALKDQGECILDNDFGTWWGRTTSGQAPYMDSAIKDIVHDLEQGRS